jgi:hypothetical protein
LKFLKKPPPDGGGFFVCGGAATLSLYPSPLVREREAGSFPLPVGRGIKGEG